MEVIYRFLETFVILVLLWGSLFFCYLPMVCIHYTYSMYTYGMYTYSMYTYGMYTNGMYTTGMCKAF